MSSKTYDTETLREAIDVGLAHKGENPPDEWGNGHVVCLFLGCDHWYGVCLGILNREGYEAYVENWIESPDGHNCRCGWEPDPPVVLVQEGCPICEKRYAEEEEKRYAEEEEQNGSEEAD